MTQGCITHAPAHARTGDMPTRLTQTGTLALALVLGLGFGLAGVMPASAQQIGTVASVEPAISGTPPGGATRPLAIGAPLVADEVISSSASGRAQLLFADQTTLNLAPNTTIVLDRFVFDPATGGGAAGLQLTEGALRFIGGTLSRQQEAVITTATASIGIRGSTAFVQIRDGRTYAIFVAGQRLCFTAQGGAQTCTSRQGGVISEDGYLGEVSPAFLASLIAEVDGAPEPGGGAAGAATSPGTGILAANPPESGPVSTAGAEFDTQIFRDDPASDVVFGRSGALQQGDQRR